VGTKLFPTYPTRATFADGVADVIATTNPRLLAVGGDGTNTVAPYIGIEHNPANIDLDKAVQLFKDASVNAGATSLTEGRLTGPAGELAWVGNTTVLSFQRADYLLLSGGELWKLSYMTMGDLADTKAIADKIAQSLRPH
jgi:hypothetical protein